MSDARRRPARAAPGRAGAATKVESQAEAEARQAFLDLYAGIDMAPQEKIDNIGLFIPRQNWCKYLFLNELYKRIIDVHGIVVEFGVRWGQNLALFSSFRGVYEPFNHNRKIVGFDTFGGFPHVHERDGAHRLVRQGAYDVAPGHEQVLEDILAYHESESPISHIRKFELVKGDVMETLDDYLGRHPQTIIALAYFDMDVYEPTRHCLQRIRPHLTKGSVLGFDELNHAPFPGETLAVREVLGLDCIRLQRVPYSPTTSFTVIE